VNHSVELATEKKARADSTHCLTIVGGNLLTYEIDASQFYQFG
jgi:hypothetical protein